MVVALAVCGGIIAAMMGGGSDEPETTGGGGDTEQPASEAPATEGEDSEEDAAGTLGEPVRDGNFEFTVNSVDCGAAQVGDEFLSDKAQGQFCLVDVTVKNIGDRPQTFLDTDQNAFDANGNEHTVDSEAGVIANDNADVWISDINPGNELNGILVFDMPADQDITSLELHDSSFSGGVKVTV